MKKESKRRNGAGGEFINVSVHFVKLIVKLVTRFDDRYAEAKFFYVSSLGYSSKGKYTLTFEDNQISF